MNLELILAAGVASGTVLLFAAIGEIFTERSGVINLGVEGMMFVGALAGFKVGIETGNPWLGLLVAMAAGALLALLHAIVCIHFQADQIVSGLALTFAGHRRGARARATASSTERTGRPAAHAHDPGAVVHPAHRPGVLHRPERPGLRGLPAGADRLLWIDHTRPGLHLRAVGEHPSAADALGIDVYRTALRVHPRRRRARGPRGRDHQHGRHARAGSRTRQTSGAGWIAVGLVIFAQWSPGGRSSAPISSRPSGA